MTRLVHIWSYTLQNNRRRKHDQEMDRERLPSCCAGNTQFSSVGDFQPVHKWHRLPMNDNDARRVCTSATETGRSLEVPV